MTYTKQTWADGIAGGTPLSADRLNHMEDGIAGASGVPSTVLTKTASYTAAVDDYVQGNTTAGGFTVTLPTAPPAGAAVAVQKISSDGNVLTIAPHAGGNIDGDTTATTAVQYAGGLFIHMGADVWHYIPIGPVGGGGGSSAFHGCKATRATNQAYTSASGLVAIQFNAADVYDTDSFHDPTSNNTRLTVPAGLTGYYTIQGSCELDGAGSSYTVVGIKKNGVELQRAGGGFASGGGPAFSIVADDHAVAGDYYEFWLFSSIDRNISVAQVAPTFAIKKVG